MAHLLLTEEGVEKKLPLNRKVTYIGRKSTCDITVADNNVSRRHARIINDSNDYLIVDTQSRNGTYVNGQKISQTFLTDDDHIRIGIEEFRFFLDPEDKEPAFQLSKYEIIEKIGRGGMGIVFKAKQKSMDRIVALKILHERFINDSDFVDRFIREAQAAGRLSHPNIIHVHDVSKEKGLYYFSMEFVSGSTLTSLLMDKGCLASPEALDILIQVAKALEYAHTNNLIHRDIKPDNIMLTGDGEVKLADLGIARNLKESDSDIKKNMIYGTPLYMSPEQALGMDLDGRTDIYSLGATAYHMMTGEPPFSGSKAIDVLKKHINENLIPPKSVNPSIPKQTSRLIEIMMKKEPEERFQSAAEVIQEIERIQKGGRITFKRTFLRETAILKKLSSEDIVEPSVEVFDVEDDKRVQHLASLDPKKRKSIFLIILFIAGLIGVFVITIYLSDIFKRHTRPRQDTAYIDTDIKKAADLRSDGKLGMEYSLLQKLARQMAPQDERLPGVEKRLEILNQFMRRQDWKTVKDSCLDTYTAFVEYAASHTEKPQEVITRGRTCLTEEFIDLFPDRTEHIRSLIAEHENKHNQTVAQQENELFELIIAQDNTGLEGFSAVRKLATEYLKKYKNANPAHAKIIRQELATAIRGEQEYITKEYKRQIASYSREIESAYNHNRFARIYSLHTSLTSREDIRNTRWEIEADTIFKKWTAILKTEFTKRKNRIHTQFTKGKFSSVMDASLALTKDFSKTAFENKAAVIRKTYSQRIKETFSSVNKLISAHRRNLEYNEARMMLIRETQRFMGTPHQDEIETLSSVIEELSELWDYLISRGEKTNIILPIVIINLGEDNILRGIKTTGAYLKLTSDDGIPPQFILWEKMKDVQIYQIFKAILIHTNAPSEYYSYLARFCKFRNLRTAMKDAQSLHRKKKEAEEEE